MRERACVNVLGGVCVLRVPLTAVFPAPYTAVYVGGMRGRRGCVCVCVRVCVCACVRVCVSVCDLPWLAFSIIYDSSLCQEFCNPLSLILSLSICLCRSEEHTSELQSH